MKSNHLMKTNRNEEENILCFCFEKSNIGNGKQCNLVRIEL